jgi:hypothetical protein
MTEIEDEITKAVLAERERIIKLIEPWKKEDYIDIDGLIIRIESPNA